MVVDREGAVLVVRMQRGEKRNAVDGEMAEGLLEAWERLRDDASVRVGVLTGTREVFSAGADLSALGSLLPDEGFKGDERERFLEGSRGYLGPTRWTGLEKPVIAAVEGPARAGGVELALLADLRIAGAGASFGFTNRAWNVPLVDGGTQRLPRVVGLGRALDLVLTGRVIDAVEAERLGLVNEVVDEGEALGRALALAERVAALPQESLRADKRSLMGGLGASLGEGLAWEARVGQEAIERDGFREDAERFLDG